MWEMKKKDVECAKNAGAISVLINRDNVEKNFGQNYVIRELKELVTIIRETAVYP